MVNLLENLVSANLTPEDLDTIIKALDIIEKKMPFLISLTKDDIKALALLHDGNRPFCEDVLVEMRQWKGTMDEGLSADELEKDLDFVRDIKNIVVRVEKLDLRLYATFIRSGAEAYNMALKFRDFLSYRASFNNEQAKEAKAIHDRISKYFVEMSTKGQKTRAENAAAKVVSDRPTDTPK